MITVLIQTHNEERHIADCIASAALLSNDILVVDTESTDGTVAIAKKLSVTVLNFPYSQYVEPVRQAGLQKCAGDWVFILDADERMTEELAHEIQTTLLQTTHSFFKVPRLNMFAGKIPLRHGGWSPDYQIRLIQKSSLVEWPARIHSTPRINGSSGQLTHSFLHLFHGNLEDMVNKTTIFEQIEADLLFQAGRPVNTITFFRKFVGELSRRLVIGRGFLDGPIGIIESIYQAFSKTVTYLLLYEKKNGRSIHPLP